MTYVQHPYVQPLSTWTAPKLEDLPRWKNATRVGLDTETCDPQLTKLGPGVRRDGYMVGVSFSVDGRKGWYLPIAHATGKNLPGSKVIAWLMDQARDFRGEIVGANLSYDLDYLLEMGIKFHSSVRFRDVQIADPLCDERHISMSLDNIAKRRGIEPKDEGRLLEFGKAWGLGRDIKTVKKNMWKLPPEAVGEYAEHDAVLPMLILERQEEDIEKQDLGEVWDLETDVLPVCLDMRRRGVKIDTKKLQTIGDWAREVEETEMARIRTMTGVNVGLGDTAKSGLLSRALAVIGLKCPMTTGTKKPRPSITAGFLKDNPHPVTNALLRARQFSKLHTTFCNQVWKSMVRGRVHCTFNQVRTQKPGVSDSGGAAKGRLSSSNFNIQNQPIRHEEYGKKWRSIYAPEDGMHWACSDFSSQEPRMAVHVACLMGYPGAQDVADRYWNDPEMDPHSSTAEMMFGEQWRALKPYYDMGAEGGERYEEAKRLRDIAKTIFLGLCYGMGGGKLCSSLGLPVEARRFQSWRTGETVDYLAAGPEGQAILDRFHAKVPYIGMLAKEATRRAEYFGYVKTFAKRRCRFRSYRGERIETHKALNWIIQGSAGDQIKYALRDLHHAGILLQITIHDEVDWSTDSFEEMRFVGETMRKAITLRVPTKVDIEYGPNWGELDYKLEAA